MYCRKEMVEILKCYLIPTKVMALCLRVQFFFGQPCRLKKLFKSFFICSKALKLGLKLFLKNNGNVYILINFNF